MGSDKLAHGVLAHLIGQKGRENWLALATAHSVINKLSSCRAGSCERTQEVTSHVRRHCSIKNDPLARVIFNETIELLNSNFLRLFLFYLAKADAKHAVFEDCANFIFFNSNRKCQGAAKFAPVAFLDVPVCCICIITTR